MSKGTRVNGKHKPADLPAKFRPGFVGALDNRTLLARALRQRFEAIAGDLGGEGELSALKQSLLERLVWLEAMLSKIESDLAASSDSKTVNEVLSRWIQAVNSFTGIAKTLGLERTMRNPWASLDAVRETAAVAPQVNVSIPEDVERKRTELARLALKFGDGTMVTQKKKINGSKSTSYSQSLRGCFRQVAA